MTPIEIMATALYNDNAGGTTDPILQDMAESTCRHDAEIAYKALEDAGFRIVPVEPTGKMEIMAGKETDNEDWTFASLYKAMLKASPHAAKG